MLPLTHIHTRMPPRHPQLSFFTMDVAAVSAEEEGVGGSSGSSRVFLYHLVPGYAAPSYGLECAQVRGGWG